MGPRAPVDVVRPDDGPRVVDDAHLGMDVDGCALGVLGGVDGHLVPARPLQRLEHVDTADQVRRQGQPAARVGNRGMTAIRRSSGASRRALASAATTAVDHRY
jgi:hypothetical protein